jgi:NADP-dependent 3-hydroxy acid dehydrogenase YdfG
MKKIVFVTGSTSGFGKAIAEKYAADKYDIIINGRREERLNELKNHLEKTYSTSVFALPFDVRKKDAVFATIDFLPDKWKSIDILINNAGLALGREFFDEADVEDWETMIDTNVKGLLYVSKAVVPLMVARKTGHIVNLGSTAGKEVYEKGNVYCASKHSVDAISRAMRIDLLRHGIKVTAVHPGAAETEFSLVRFKGDKAKASAVYEGFQPLVAQDVANVIHYCTSLPAHVCINDLVLTCTAQADSFYFFKT